MTDVQREIELLDENTNLELGILLDRNFETQFTLPTLSSLQLLDV
jgi:hypothetical protein